MIKTIHRIAKLTLIALVSAFFVMICGKLALAPPNVKSVGMLGPTMEELQGSSTAHRWVDIAVVSLAIAIVPVFLAMRLARKRLDAEESISVSDSGTG